ncbi:protein FAR1-RELATED SEQUENCE 5-like [Chenopodium quinoa]|uniref:protein FAR1-RELATED SEQUENCE 5-like n=1 Tax=Chenopodium quinoa TaxID=63459 RepID=UPI000B785D39|nr:protein FAR1-RELATED SEQUENCE 5-like [Chenopodium quinoa]
MLVKYDLVGNSWLERVYNLREKWALVYGRQTFCADMSTTQRSESMNAQLRRYSSNKNHLCQFFEHFERLLNDRRYEESVADFKTKHSSPALPYPVRILKHASTIYTAEVFELFQCQIWKAWDCIIEEEEVVGTTYRYKVYPPRKKIDHFVTYNPENDTISCSCRKFEFVGILCSHALKVLCSKNIHKITNQYILQRWKKDAKVEICQQHKLSTRQVDEKICSRIRFQELGKLFTHFAGVAAQSEDTCKWALDVHQKSLAEVEARLKKLISGEEDDNEEESIDCEENVNVELQCDTSTVKGIKMRGSSHGSRGRGRGNGSNNGSTRCKSSLEKGRTRKKHCTNDQDDESHVP